MVSFSEGYEKFATILDSIIVDKIRVGVAISGGADSILLFHFLYRYYQENTSKIAYLIMIHIIDGHQLFDFSLIEFVDSVKSLISNLQIQFKLECVFCENTDISIFSKGESVEGVCHKLRKMYFDKIIKEYSLDKILIGHTEDDQLEHFFIALARRASLERIGGMEMVSDKYIRPLLFMSKDNVRKILIDNELIFYDDPCNKRVEYLRNNIRKNIISILNKIDNRLKKGILESMKRIKLANQYIDNEVERLLFEKYERIYNIDFFLQLNSFLQYKVLEKLCMMKFNFVITKGFHVEIINFLRNKKSIKHVLGKIIVMKRKNIFFLYLNFNL